MLRNKDASRPPSDPHGGWVRVAVSYVDGNGIPRERTTTMTVEQWEKKSFQAHSVMRMIDSAVVAAKEAREEAKAKSERAFGWILRSFMS